MHLYIYDSFLNQKKYERILAQIETRLTDLGLNGKISRLGVMKNINGIINHELRFGIKTIIAVGNDRTINQILNSTNNFSLPLGIIPIGKENNQIAKSLGIESYLNACEILSARRIIKIDLGLANEARFLSYASISNQGTIIEVSENYSIEIMGQGKVEVINLNGIKMDLANKTKINPTDGILELLIEAKEPKRLFNQKTNFSIFPIKKLVIKNKKSPIILDGATEVTPPAEIRVIKQKLNIIVGRERNF